MSPERLQHEFSLPPREAALGAAPCLYCDRPADEIFDTSECPGRLRQALDAERARAEAAPADEREAVVTWLRTGPETIVECDGHRHRDGERCAVLRELDLTQAADAIERGEHRRREP